MNRTKIVEYRYLIAALNIREIAKSIVTEDVLAIIDEWIGEMLSEILPSSGCNDEEDDDESQLHQWMLIPFFMVLLRGIILKRKEILDAVEQHFPGECDPYLFDKGNPSYVKWDHHVGGALRYAKTKGILIHDEIGHTYTLNPFWEGTYRPAY